MPRVEYDLVPRGMMRLSTYERVVTKAMGSTPACTDEPARLPTLRYVASDRVQERRGQAYQGTKLRAGRATHGRRAADYITPMRISPTAHEAPSNYPFSSRAYGSPSAAGAPIRFCKVSHQVMMTSTTIVAM